MTPSSTDIAKPEQGKVQGHWRELDVLRGIAAIMMIVNHVGVKFMSPQYTEGGFAGALLFMGSFAPVMFFFVTGVGTGIQSSRRKTVSRWSSVLNKVGILVLADLLMAWSGGHWWQLDFLGFIGLSTLVLELVRNSKRPIALSIAGLVLISGLRYLVGPVVHHLGYDQRIWGLAFVLGTAPLPRVSYPLAPWLAYPLLGYLLGVATSHFQLLIEKQRLKVIVGLMAAAVVPAIAAWFLASRGAIFFRWGSVSLAFHIISFTTVLLCLALSLLLCSDRRIDFISNAVTLKGISSLAVVPIHYFIIDISIWAGVQALQPADCYPWVVIILIFSFLAATFIEQVGNTVRQMPHKVILRSSFIGVFVASVCVAVTTNSTNSGTATFAKTVGQLALCLLFVLPPQAKI